MVSKIIKLCRDTNVVWIFDEDAQEEYGEATLIYGVSHVKKLTRDVYEIKNKNITISLQFGVKEVKEEW